jgi:hypothetical protein
MNLYDVINKIKSDLNTNSDKVKLDLIYAFNGTGKTRISRSLVEDNNEQCLCFNSLFQDDFTWDNDRYILQIRDNSWIVNLINEQGLQNEIINNFQNMYNQDIEPVFSEDSKNTSFNSKTVDGYDKFVKISKAEETLFIWAVFYTFLSMAITELSEKVDERSSNIFDNINYIIIDDPVSSVDDSIIIRLAISITQLIDKCKSDDKHLNLKFLITTHHALFYNTIFNLVDRDSLIKNKSYVLSRKDYIYDLKEKGDTPFGYHLVLRDTLYDTVTSNNISKSHFNMFRILLEKTSNYFGYKKYDECLPNLEDKVEMIKLLNLYSHGSLSDFEYSELTDKDKQLFKAFFEGYIDKYKGSEINE